MEKNNKQLKSVAEEFTKYDYHDFCKITDYVFDKQYKFMLINSDNNKLFKKFNEIQTNNIKKEYYCYRMVIL